MHGPLSRFRIVVVIIVLAVGDVVMMDCIDDRAVAVVPIEIQILFPPFGIRIAVAISGDKLRDVRPVGDLGRACLLYTSPSPRDKRQSRMPSSA